jgi:hypothetical protein
MPRADRTNTTPDMRPRCIGKLGLLATVALALSGPAAFAWDYSAPTPPPSDPPATTITNSPMGGVGGVGGQGGTGGQGGSAHAAASARGGNAHASGGNASLSVTIDPATATAPTRSTTAGDPSGSRRSAGAGDPSGAGDPAGDGRHGGRGGGVAVPPGFALPSFDAGQCSTVDFGIAISPSGGGAFGPAWESTNCRAYYNALALYKMGYQEQAVALLRRVFPDVDAAFASTTPKVAPVNAPPAAPAIDCNVVNAAQTGHGRMSPAELQAYRACHA